MADKAIRNIRNPKVFPFFLGQTTLIISRTTKSFGTNSGVDEISLVGIRDNRHHDSKP
jgi:hypothetical protein